MPAKEDDRAKNLEDMLSGMKMPQNNSKHIHIQTPDRRYS